MNSVLINPGWVSAAGREYAVQARMAVIAGQEGRFMAGNDR
jgi:hypothetical protein